MNKGQVKSFKALVATTLIGSSLALIGIPLLKHDLFASSVPDGYSNFQTMIYFILAYLVLAVLPVTSIVSYRELVKNKKTEPTLAKRIYIYFSPVGFLIIGVFLGIFVK